MEDHRLQFWACVPSEIRELFSFLFTFALQLRSISLIIVADACGVGKHHTWERMHEPHKCFYYDLGISKNQVACKWLCDSTTKCFSCWWTWIVWIEGMEYTIVNIEMFTPITDTLKHSWIVYLWIATIGKSRVYNNDIFRITCSQYRYLFDIAIRNCLNCASSENRHLILWSISRS